MLTRAYVTLVLAAAVANAPESYDVTNCGASTVTTVSATEELTVISVDTKGITRSNSRAASSTSACQKHPGASLLGRPIIPESRHRPGPPRTR